MICYQPWRTSLTLVIIWRLWRDYIFQKKYLHCVQRLLYGVITHCGQVLERQYRSVYYKKKNYTVFSDVCTMLSAIADKCMRGSTEVYYTQKMFILYLVTFLRCYQPLRTSSWGAVPRWCAAWCRGFPFSRWRFFCQFICIYIWYLYIFNVYMYLKCVCI